MYVCVFVFTYLPPLMCSAQLKISFIVDTPYLTHLNACLNSEGLGNMVAAERWGGKRVGL